MCESFVGANNKKENLDQLRGELLSKELEFKTELFKIQLETARKELEIKEEILKKIKGNFVIYNYI